eukprot:519383-Pelagomonas_calceolata.AAC.7
MLSHAHDRPQELAAAPGKKAVPSLPKTKASSIKTCKVKKSSGSKACLGCHSWLKPQTGKGT